MSPDLWFTFVAASVALLLIPGPTVLLVLSYALSQGRRVALATAAGVALGDLIAMTASLAGLGALVMASATVFSVVKWIGAIYLIYMGLRLILGAKNARLGELPKGKDLSPGAAFTHTAMVTAFNPKSIAFFIAFVPQFIRPETALLPQFAILIATFVVLATINALAYALLAARLRARIKKPAVIQWLSRIGGTALVSMGVMTASLRRATF